MTTEAWLTLGGVVLTALVAVGAAVHSMSAQTSAVEEKVTKHAAGKVLRLEAATRKEIRELREDVDEDLKRAREDADRVYARESVVAAIDARLSDLVRNGEETRQLVQEMHRMILSQQT